MADYGMEAILVKVSSAGLIPNKHLGKTITELLPTFEVRRRVGERVAGNRD